MSQGKPKRYASPGHRHRRDNGPAALEVIAVAPPSNHQLGQLHVHTDTVLAGGARALIAAEHEAQRLSAKFGEEIEAKWCLATPWLLKLANGEPDDSVDSVASSDANQPEARYSNAARQRARARYAMQWRPRFLAVVALTRSIMLGCRAARVSRMMVNRQRHDDKDFDTQIIAAQASAVELLADMTMRTAIEGECKPIYWQGIQVGHERIVDNRLRIEMLRAYKPDRFKTPGSKVSVHTGDNVFAGQNVIFTGPVMQNLMAMRQEALKAIGEKMATGHEVGTPALPPVPPAP